MNHPKTLLSAIVATVLLAGCNQAPTTTAPATDNTAPAPATDTAPAPAADTAPPPQDTQPATAANEPAPAPEPTATQQPDAAPPVASEPPPRVVSPPPRVVVPPPRVGYPAPIKYPQNPAADNDFYRNALAGGEKEIQISRLAASHSRNPDVKRLANMLISDHVALDSRLSSASGMKSVPPQDGSALHELRNLFGPQFDNRYLAILQADHRDAIALFNNASRNARTGAARSLAGNSVPKLREHLADVQRTQASVQRNPAPHNPPPRNHPHH